MTSDIIRADEILRIDSACDRFEEACRSGQPPLIELYLTEFSSVGAARLLRELVAIERDFGLGKSDLEYAARFPEFSHIWLPDSPTAKAGADRLKNPDAQATLLMETPPAVASAGSGARLDAGGMPVASGITRARFRVLRPHARGGLGEVSVAFDEELRREVALKEILPCHLDRPTAHARFSAEAEITGRLEHPGIVPVYSLGRHANGAPYYAMRFIKGESLHKAIRALYDSANALDPGQRSLAMRGLLSRWITVCHTMEYAHAKRVIHRDLKPANILVGKFGETLIVDWGLAKVLPASAAAEGEGPASCAFESPSDTVSGEGSPTVEGTVLGTPAYMSPEQAAGNTQEIGPASDIYSLGAILYAIITGEQAFPSGSLEQVVSQVQRGDFTPPRKRNPSARIPAALEAICLKAMALAPQDRYASAANLAADMERFLADEPVLALAESWTAKLARLTRRHRAWAHSAVVMLAIAAVGSMLAAIIFNDLKNEANHNQQVAEANAIQARAAEANERTARQKEAEARALAELRLERIRDGNELLVSIFKDLDPTRLKQDGRPLDAILGERLEGAVTLLKKAPSEDRLTTAEIQVWLALALHGLGRFELEASVLEDALQARQELLGPEDPETLITMNNLGLAYQALGRFTEAQQLLEKTLAARERVLPKDHVVTLGTQMNLATNYHDLGQFDRAIDLFHQAHANMLRVLGPKDPDTLLCQQNLASCLLDAGQFEESAELSRATVELQEQVLDANHPTLLAAKMTLAGALAETDSLDESAALLQEILDVTLRRLGPDHFNTLTVMNNLAVTYHEAGKLQQALALYEQLVPKLEKQLGRTHIDVMLAKHNLAALYDELAIHGKSLPVYEQLLLEANSTLGPEHPYSLTFAHSLGVSLSEQGLYERAIAVLEKVAERRAAVLGPENKDTLGSLSALGGTLILAGQNERAVALLEDLVKRKTAALGEDHPNVLSTLSLLASAYDASQQYDKCIELHQLVLARQTKLLGESHPATLGSLSNLGASLNEAGRSSEAIPLLEQAIKGRVQLLGESHPGTLVTTWNLARAHEATQSMDAAVRLATSIVDRAEAAEFNFAGPARVAVKEAAKMLAKHFTLQGNVEQSERYNKIAQLLSAPQQE